MLPLLPLWLSIVLLNAYDKKNLNLKWSGFLRVSGVICNKRVPARLEVKVYKTVVSTAMSYGLKTVALTKRQEEVFEVAESKKLRFSLGIRRMDRIRMRILE